MLRGVCKLLTVLAACPSIAMAADHYVRADATGTGNGSDWNNAFATLPAILVRGDTYYVAEGSYGSYSFDDPVSGATYIHVKKATPTSHGTNTGWSDTYGDEPANFTSWDIASKYWVLDGQVGQWAGSVYGVPALPNHVPYGFRVIRNTTANGASLIRSGSSGGEAVTNVTLRHVEAAYTNTPRQIGAWGANQDCLSSRTADLTVSHAWFHDCGRTAMISTNRDNVVIEYSVLERNGHAAAAGVELGGSSEHSEIAAMWGHPLHTSKGPTGIVFRNNYIRDWRSTGGIMVMGSDAQSITLYGNVFSTTGYWTTTDTGNSNGVLNGLDSSQTINAIVRAYNNTFVDVDHGANVFTAGDYSVREVKNNLFCNVSGFQGQILSVGASGPSRSHNWYFNSGTQSESNIQYGTGDPFVDRANGDYQLLDASDAGDTSIGALYNTDPDGVSRGGDENWDRGAFEFVEGFVSIPSPSPPQNLRVVE